MLTNLNAGKLAAKMLGSIAAANDIYAPCLDIEMMALVEKNRTIGHDGYMRLMKAWHEGHSQVMSAALMVEFA